MTKQITCFYHPDVVANTTCERCHRPICLNDVRTYQRRRSTHFDDDTHYYYEKYTLCPLCYADWIERDNSIVAQVLQLGIVAFAVVFMFFALGMFGTFLSMGGFGGMAGIFGFLPLVFIAVPLIIIAVVLYNVFIASPRRVREARAQKELFLASLGSQPSTSAMMNQGEIVSSSSIGASLTCFECGAPLAITDKFCPNCGDPTTEERASLRP